MNISYNTIKKYLDKDISIKKLRDKVNNHIIEIENDFSFLKSDKLVIGKTVKVEKHPESKKLKIAQVDLGTETVQIICGSPNLKENQKVIVAPSGTNLGPDFKIEKKNLAGYESNGMICGLDEILNVDSRQIKSKHLSGIVELPNDFSAGTMLSDTSFNDVIFEIGLTPNRNDLLSLVGQNNDLACLFEKKYKLPELSSEIIINSRYLSKIETNDSLALNIHQFNNINIKEDILNEINLLKYNIRSIDPIVDLSNEVMIETGQPIHFYDADKIIGTTITVRNANQGEKITLLNGIEYILEESDLVICDEKGPISLAGVMGGERTKCDEKTKNILVEIASFSPKSIRKTATRTNNRSDASSRFEKGISQWNTKYAADYLIKKLKDNYVGSVVMDKRISKNNPIIISLKELTNFIGQKIDYDSVIKILSNLNYDLKMKEDEITIEVPEFLNTQQTKEDIYEEIVRFYGLNHINFTEEINNEIGLNKSQLSTRNIEKRLTSIGLNEVVTYSLVSQTSNNLFNHSDIIIEEVKLLHPQSQARTNMKTNGVQSLLDVIVYNNNRQENSVNIFEFGKRYGFNLNERNEENVLTIAIQREFNKEEASFYIIREIFESILVKEYKLNKDRIKLKQVDSITGMHPYQTTEIYYDDLYIGYLGKLMPDILNETYVGEILVDKINEIGFNKSLEVAKISKFPITKRIFTIQTPKNIQQEEIISTLKNGQKNLSEINFITIFDEQEIISSTYELQYQSLDSVISSEMIKQNEEIIERNIESQGWKIK
jgi:phenylalanyl-tRNA synthetase beta chain